MFVDVAHVKLPGVLTRLKHSVLLWKYNAWEGELSEIDERSIDTPIARSMDTHHSQPRQ